MSIEDTVIANYQCGAPVWFYRFDQAGDPEWTLEQFKAKMFTYNAARALLITIRKIDGSISTEPAP